MVKRSLPLLGAATLVATLGCSVTAIPTGFPACVSDAGCEPGWSCISLRCWSAGTGPDAGLSSTTSSGSVGGTSAGSTSGSGTSTGGSPSAIAFVQYAQSQDFGDSSVSSLSTPAFTSPVITGDLLVAAVTYGGGQGTPISLTDSYGNVFQTIDDVYDDGELQGLRTLYKANAVGGPAGDVFAATFADQSPNVAIYVAEYSGLDPLSPLVAHQSTFSAGVGPGTNAFEVPLDIPRAPALLWAFCDDDNDGEPKNGFSAGAGFTLRGPSSGLWVVDNDVFFGSSEDLFATTSGAVDATWSVTKADDFLATAAVFQVPDGGQ